MVLVSVVTSDPVGCRDDVDARLKDFHVQILVGEHAVERQDVGLGRDDLVDRTGCDYSVGGSPTISPASRPILSVV